MATSPSEIALEASPLAMATTSSLPEVDPENEKLKTSQEVVEVSHREAVEDHEEASTPRVVVVDLIGLFRLLSQPSTEEDEEDSVVVVEVVDSRSVTVSAATRTTIENSMKMMMKRRKEPARS